MSSSHELFMVSMGKRLYNITLPNTGRSCLVGMTSHKGANKLRAYVAGNRPIHVEISSVDFQEPEFYKTMKLNNFALMVCDDVDMNGSKIEFEGSLIDVDYPPDDEHRFFFDHLLNIPDSI